MPEDFNKQLRDAFARHTEFKPRTIEVARKSRQAYEKRPDVIARHRAWDHTEAGRESMLRRSKKYYDTHREQVREKNRRWYEATAPIRRAKRKEYAASHKEQIREYNKRTRENIKQDPERLAKVKAQRKAWVEAHREEIKLKAREYRARKKAEKLAAMEAAKNVNTAA